MSTIPTQGGECRPAFAMRRATVAMLTTSLILTVVGALASIHELTAVGAACTIVCAAALMLLDTDDACPRRLILPGTTQDTNGDHR